MALTEIYVDPSIDANSGAGTSGDPYGDLQYALDTGSMSASGGTRINIKSGTDEVLTAALSDATFFTTNSPAAANPLVFEGYTTTAGDGGQGAISGANTYSIYTESAQSYVFFKSLKMYNTGSAQIADLDNWCGYIDCEFTSSSATPSVACDNGFAIGCYFHDLTGGGFRGVATHVDHCKFINISGSYNIESNSGPSMITNNIIWIDSVATDGINYDNMTFVAHNSIFQNAAGTGHGIGARSSGKSGMNLLNNLVEGFSGTGGIGIDSSDFSATFIGNQVYDCTTEFSGTADTVYLSNTTLVSSPFNDGANKDLSPVDAVIEEALPAEVGTL